MLVAEPLPVHAASSLVQQNSVLCIRAGGNPSCGPTLSASFSNNVASGNVIVVAAYVDDSTAVTVTSVDDSRSSSFTRVASSNGNQYAYIYYAMLSSSGPNTVTVTFSSTPSLLNGFAYLFIYEVFGVTTTGVTTGTGSGSSGSVSTSSTGFASGAFLVAIIGGVWMSSNWGAGSGFQFSPTPPYDEFISMSRAEYSTSGVSSPTTFPATLSPNQNWVEVGIALNPKPGISLDPTFGSPETTVTVTGSGFTVTAQPFCEFTSNPSGLVGPNRGTDYDCMIAGDGSIATAWFVVAGGSSGSYSVTVTYFGQTSNAAQFTIPRASAPVGGFIEPTNKLTVIAPYMGLLGVIAAVALVAVKPWKKTSD